MYHSTLGGIASICFKFHFQTDDQQTLRMHTQGCQGCQKIRNLLRISKILIARSTIHPSLSKIKNHYWKTSKIEKKNYQSINGDFFTTKKYFSIWKLNFFAIFLMNFAAFFNGFWFYSILAGWSTWQWVFLNFSQNFWSFDTPDTHGCASAVIWNRFEPFLLQCNSSSAPLFVWTTLFVQNFLFVHTTLIVWTTLFTQSPHAQRVSKNMCNKVHTCKYCCFLI
jgi:hypothetical protein